MIVISANSCTDSQLATQVLAAAAGSTRCFRIVLVAKPIATSVAGTACDRAGNKKKDEERMAVEKADGETGE